MKTKSLMDLLFEFVDQTNTHVKIEKLDGWVITVDITGCIDHVRKTNQMIIEKLAGDYSFEPVIIKDHRFVYECVEKDVTLIINHNSKDTHCKRDDKKREK